MPEQLPVSVIFVTHNRIDLLRKAIQAVKEQTIPAEILVMDDASNDGTDVMMRSEFPEIHYCRSEKSMGPSFQRNLGAEKASSEILVFLDDDTVLQSSDTLEIVVKDFDSPEIGAIAIPFINILQSDKVSTSAPDKAKTYVLHAFVAAAFAIKRSIFIRLGGFRVDYFYMGEEGDLSIRLLEAGYFVKAGTCAPVHHYQPPNRISFKADFYGRRNDILFLYLNSPRTMFLPALAATIFKGLLFGIKVGRFGNMSKGIMAGMKLMGQDKIKAQVKPIRKDVFINYRYLKKNEPTVLG